MTNEQQGAELTEGDDTPEVSLWRYTGDVERFYGGPVVTARQGTVIEHAGPPAEDGCWEQVEGSLGDDEQVQRPDNVPPSDELDAYGHYVVDGRSVAGPATWDHGLGDETVPMGGAQQDTAHAGRLRDGAEAAELGETDDGAGHEQQQMMIDDEHAGPTGEQQ